jgi:Zn-dependent M28 family amino/carboxypeptidase
MQRVLILLISALALSCTGSRRADLQPALDSITGDDLMRHTRVLASDEYEGRAPGTKGEELTVRYLEQQFARMGLEPGNPDGSWVQPVPLVGIRSQTTASIQAGGRRIPLVPQDYFAHSRRVVETVQVNDTNMLFVGYGVVAPEFGWDDYKGVDVKGKTILMLINDPPVPDPGDPTKLDESVFGGRAMTYYGRWTYKYETASEKGAAAAVIIHETGAAGYPFAVISDWGLEKFEIRRPDGNMGRVPIEGWITFDKAQELFRMAGQDLGELKKAAIRRDFRPVPLNAKAGFTVRNSIREVDSRNVIARLEGSDPRLNDDYAIYTAHWDHLGRDETLKGDQIFNGALDNASGVACLLELAEAFARLPERPRRSLLFLSVTAEEQGLLGALHYAENPLYPLKKTLAVINMDGANPWGRTSDVVIIGQGKSTLEDLAAEVAREQGRTLKPDPEPEKGFYYRSDHFELAKQGLPALYTDNGVDYIGKPAGYGLNKRDEYTANDYHKVTDEIKADWDLAGAAEDTRFLFLVGYRVAQADRFPEWKPSSEFKAKRDAMMK